MSKFTNRYLRVRAWPAGYTVPVEFTQDWKILYRVHKYASTGVLGYNQAEISIHNMKESLRDTLSQKYMPVEIEAGYENSHDIIFKGYLYNLITSKQSTELVTTLFCASNRAVYGESVNRCVQNMSVTDLISQLCSEYKVPYRLNLKRNDIVSSSYTGAFSKVIALICKEYNITCSMENGELLFTDKLVDEESINNTIVKVYTPSSGLIGNPMVTERGVKFKSLLTPELKVTDIFRLEAPYADYSLNNVANTPGLILGNKLNVYAHINTRTYNGLYMALNIVESGDTRGNAWYTEVEGSRIRPGGYDAE